MQEYTMPHREQNSNKGSFGKVLNVAGSKNYTGAAFFSSLSALKIGAGYVALSSSNIVTNSVAKILPDAVYISRHKGFKDLRFFSLLLIGCGLGLSLSARYDFKKFIKLARKYNIPTIIDADGLNILSKLKNIQLPQNTIITPHPMEAARLLNINVEDVLENLDKCALDLCKKYNCITVLKTHRTLICAKDKQYTNIHGNSALAKAGSGDVLAGVIAGLAAQKMDLFEAAKLGVYLHSRAGEIASEDLTEYSVQASDLINYLPKAIKEIL